MTSGAGDLLEKGNFGNEDGEMQINLSGNPWTYEPEEYRDYWTEFEAEVTRGFVLVADKVLKDKFPELNVNDAKGLRDYLAGKGVERIKARAVVHIAKQGSLARPAALLVRGAGMVGLVGSGVGWLVFAVEAVDIVNNILKLTVSALQAGPGAMIEKTSNRITGAWWSCALANGLENAPVEQINEKCGGW